MDKALISAVVPVHNSAGTIRLCLQGIIEQSVPFDEIILVDDGSTDDACSSLEGIMNITVIKLPSKMGPAFARNAGARHASGEIIFFVDSDVRLPANAVHEVRMIFSKWENLVCVCGIYSKSVFRKNDFISQYRALTQHFWKKSECGNTARFACSVGAIKRDVFSEMGGFDERFLGPDVEDYEFGHRLTARGYSILQTDSIVADHNDEKSLFQLAKAVFSRAYSYAGLFMKRRKIDTGYLGRRRVLVFPVALFSIVLLSASFFENRLFLFWVLSFAVFIILDLDLYRLFLKEKGIIFLCAGTILHFFFILVMGSGFLTGLIVQLIWPRTKDIK